MAYLIYEHGERASNLAITSNYEIYYEHSVLVTKVQTTTKNNLNSWLVPVSLMIRLATLNLLMMVEIVVKIRV